MRNPWEASGSLRCAALAMGAGAASALTGVWIADRLARRRRSREIPRTLTLPPGQAAAGMKDTASVQFIGTATVILRCGSFTILTDPNFLHGGEKIHLAYGLLSSRRLTNPALDIDELPDIDMVILSHMHEDHFDLVTARRLDKSVPIVTTHDAARALRRKGFHQVHALRKWQQMEIRKGADSIRLTAMPGRHGPMLMQSLLPGVNGSMLDFFSSGRFRLRLYISGDTLVHRDLRKIPGRFPNVDVALLHLGGTRVFGILLTMDAEQGVEAMKIIAPTVAIPIHYNDYDIFKSPIEDFRRAVAEAGLEDNLVYLKHGEIFEFPLTADARSRELAGIRRQ